VVWVQPCGCVVVSARQGKAQAGGEGEAGSGSDLWVPAPWSGLPEGEVQTGRWAVVVVVEACVFVLEQWAVYRVGRVVLLSTSMLPCVGGGSGAGLFH
jgi:hypothetical protein